MKKYLFPTILFIVTLIILVSGVFLVFFLLSRDTSPTATAIRAENLSVVILDDDWAEFFVTKTTTEEQKLFLDETLTQVKNWGSNAVALTGRVGDAVIFRDKNEELTTHSIIVQNDTFFTKFDPLEYLVQIATANGVEVLLTPTTQTGELAYALNSEPFAAFVTEQSEIYDMRILSEKQSWADAIVAAEQAGTVLGTVRTYAIFGDDTTQILRDDVNPTNLATILQLTAPNDINLVLGEYSSLINDDEKISLLSSYLSGTALPDITTALGGKTVSQTLAVGYPIENNTTVTNSDLFLMGTSDPNSALSINGEELPRFGTNGVWGILVELEFGENEFVFENGSQTLTHTVTLNRWTGTASDTLGNGTHKNLEEGQKIRITDAIASALTDPYNSGSISQTLYIGAVAEVTRSISRSDDDSSVYAYQLTTGDYVRAASCELISAQTPTLTAPSMQWDAEKRTSVLTFAGATPAVYHDWQEKTLTITFHAANLENATAIPSGDWFTVATNIAEDSFSLIFTFTEDMPLFGWAVVYDTQANTTQLSLKQPPTLSSDEAKPLTGVRVMLDAGHGLDDTGAMGSAGQSAPAEKDVNLALSIATQYRLEQLGATVIMTRTDDTFPTLGDRITALNTIQPDYFISVHHNSVNLTTDVNDVTGVESYWFYDEGDAFAATIIQNLCDATGRQNRGSKYGYYYVTRSNICPATLLEVGFMTNPAEYEDIVNIETLWEEADAIAMAIYESVANLD